MITPEDVVIALSNSGTSEEVLTIVPLVKRQGAQLISITGRPESPLAQQADIHLEAIVAEEACPLNLAPTASTTAALALGDALAVALLDARGFGTDDFARSHPGGALGRRLLPHVGDVMRPAEAVPMVASDAPLTQALLAMTAGGMGMTAVCDADSRPIGIFTDGDLRRLLEAGRSGDFRTVAVDEVMTRSPVLIGPTALAAEAVRIMEDRQISQLLVVSDERLVGALTLLDLLAAKIV